MAEPGASLSASRSACRRHLTLLFSDLSDSTTLAGSVEPEHYLEVLDHLRSCAQTVILRHGGTLVESRGDGILAMFGFPESSEHDGRRATEAALELHDAIARPRVRALSAIPPLCMHSGIHSGLVLVIESGDAGYALVGEATSIAARLSDAANRNEILVSATTLGTESPFFEIRERGDLMLHGKAAAVTAYQVLGRSSINTRFEARSRHGLTPFVGRADELALLDRTLNEAMSGRLRSISVIGDAGVGKTRLAQEFLKTSAAMSCAIYRGYCDDYQTAEPHQPFLQILRAVCKLNPRIPAPFSIDELQQRIQGDPDLVGVHAELVRAASLALTGRYAPDPRQTAAEGVPEAIRDLMSAIAARRPVVLFLDDWQWADDASRQVLASLRGLKHQKILVVTTSRVIPHDDVPLHESEVRLAVAPLNDDQAHTTIRALRPTADPFAVRRFQQLSGGNPLFIEELCHARERDALEGHSERSTVGPAWLSTLIESRVARLSAEAADLVRTAAVIGTVMPSWLLERLTGRGENDEMVRALAEKDLIFPADGGSLRFKHGITREVIYQSVGLREREQTHLRIAELLRERWVEGGRDDLFEALAYHYRAGAKPDLAAEYAERAGDKALATAALDRARAHYCTALDLLEPSDATYSRWISIAQRLGLACVYDPARDQLPIFLRAVELAEARADDAALARAEYWLGYINYGLGELSAAILHCEAARQHCARALATVRSAPDSLPSVDLEAHAVQVLATLGQARAAACERDGVLEQLDEAIAVKRHYRTGRRPAVGFAYTLACKGWVLGDRGQFGDAHACFAEAFDAVRGDTQPVRASILGWQAAVYLWQGRWSDARAASIEAQRLAERVESLYILAMNQTLGEYARWMLERTPDAIEPMVRATSWLEARDKRLHISLSYGWIAETMLAAGRYPEARAYAARALRRARDRDRLGEPMAYRVLARLPAAHRRHPPEHYLDAAMRSAEGRRSPHEQAVTLLHRAEVAAADGKAAEAAALLARACSAFSAMEMRWHLRQTQRILITQ
jgi:class 3 adenylate cyclase/tetratricopeptide (TPR) repeat protein